MEMLTDVLLLQWVPKWVVEQYNRANPFFREVLRALQPHGDLGPKSNKHLLKKTKREMVRRHHRQLAKDAARRQREKERASGKVVSSSEDGVFHRSPFGLSRKFFPFAGS